MADEMDPQAQRKLKKFNQEHLEEALAGVFSKAAVDPRFRALCLKSPREAIHEVSPDLDLPEEFKVNFVEQGKDVVHSYLLPTPLPAPTLFELEQLRRYTKESFDNFVNNAANLTCTGTPQGTVHDTGVRCKGNPTGSGGQEF